MTGGAWRRIFASWRRGGSSLDQHEAPLAEATALRDIMASDARELTQFQVRLDVKSCSKGFGAFPWCTCAACDIMATNSTGLNELQVRTYNYIFGRWRCGTRPPAIGS